ncbi:hypothetical protein R1sor_004437 [Riccia sorocarpa]|uniref:Uncharacterized protein n=1 Tax=Riccia sorocarpa TaxID=122646 RepID=A0ABD3HIX0_9MARC
MTRLRYLHSAVKRPWVCCLNGLFYRWRVQKNDYLDLQKSHIAHQREELQSFREVYKEKGEVRDLQKRLIDALWEARATKNYGRRLSAGKKVKYILSNSVRSPFPSLRAPDTELDDLREKLKEDAELHFNDLATNEKDPKVLKARYEELARLEKTVNLERAALGKKARDFYARMRKKWSTRDHDLVDMQGTDLTLSVYRGLESMWPRDSLTRWTEGGKDVKRSMFPGWIALPTSEGGNYVPEVDKGRDGIGRLPQPLEVPTIWHDALCKFCLDGKMETAKKAARKNAQEVTYATTEEGPRRRALAVPFLKEIIVAYKGAYKRGRNDRVAMDRLVEYYRSVMDDRFPDSLLHPDDNCRAYDFRAEMKTQIYCYLRPELAPPTAMPEYVDDLINLTNTWWPPECWGCSGGFRL